MGWYSCFLHRQLCYTCHDHQIRLWRDPFRNSVLQHWCIISPLPRYLKRDQVDQVGKVLERKQDGTRWPRRGIVHCYPRRWLEADGRKFCSFRGPNFYSLGYSAMSSFDLLAAEVKVNGQCCFATRLCLTSTTQKLTVSSRHDDVETNIGSSHSIPKVVASIVQFVLMTVTLYRARGTQFEKYGYASFSLTVIPYAIMSLVNLMANLLTPDYPCMYLVHTDTMEEVAERGAKFDGVVGKVAKMNARQRRETKAPYALGGFVYRKKSWQELWMNNVGRIIFFCRVGRPVCYDWRFYKILTTSQHCKPTRMDYILVGCRTGWRNNYSLCDELCGSLAAPSSNTCIWNRVYCSSNRGVCYCWFDDQRIRKLYKCVKYTLLIYWLPRLLVAPASSFAILLYIYCFN